jgi:hypothetical protein
VSTFRIVVPTSTLLAVEGKPSTVTVTIIGDVADVVIVTTPAPVAPPVPSEYWQHDPDADEPPPASSFRDYDPEAENDPWLQGR